MVERRETPLTEPSVWVGANFEHSQDWIVHLAADRYNAGARQGAPTQVIAP